MKRDRLIGGIIIALLNASIAILGCYGLFCLYGTAGAVECEKLTISEGIMQSLKGVASVGVSAIVYKLIH